MRRVRRFLALPATDRRLVVKAWLVELGIRTGLWLLPFREIRKRVAAVHSPSPAAHPADQHVDTDRRIAWAVTSAARYVPAATCLTQALAAKVLLTRMGREARLT